MAEVGETQLGLVVMRAKQTADRSLFLREELHQVFRCLQFTDVYSN